jgi:hypothetical protein
MRSSAIGSAIIVKLDGFYAHFLDLIYMDWHTGDGHWSAQEIVTTGAYPLNFLLCMFSYYKSVNHQSLHDPRFHGTSLVTVYVLH